MQIFGVGPLEFLLVLVLALVIMGPEDMVGTARKLGQWVYRVVRSPTWRAILETSQDLRDLPTKIIRDAGLDETIQEIKQTASDVKSDLDETTREINKEMQVTSAEVSKEMQAATMQVNSELQTAVQEANAGLKGNEAAALGAGIAPGLTMTENSIAPPEAQGAEAASTATEDALPPTPYELQLAAFATGLSGKAIQSAEPEQNALISAESEENAPSSTPGVVVETMPSFQHQPYAVQLEAFAGALGTSGTEPSFQEPAVNEPVPEAPQPTPAEAPPLAAGVAPGLAIQSGGGIDTALQNRMEQLSKSLEKLDARIAQSDGDGKVPGTEEFQPVSTQAENQPQDGKDGHEPEPKPRAKTRRKKAAPAAQDDEGKPKPRKKRTPRAKVASDSPAQGQVGAASSEG